MGGDDSQKLLPCRGSYSPPGRKPPAQLRINNVTETAGWNLARGTPSFWPGLSYRPPGSLLESRGGSILPRAEGQTEARLNDVVGRSEERRVGEEGRSRWWPD